MEADQVASPATINVNTPSVSIQPIPEFNPDAEIGASLATRWNNWLEDFEMFILASGITDDKRKRALLLYQAGSRVREIFRQIQDTGVESDYKIAKDKLTEYFEPQKNRRYEVYRFRQATQDPNETLDQFHTRLRTLAQTCSFPDVDFEIEQQIITAGTSSRIRKKALRDPNYDLKAILLDGRRDEQSAFQARHIESKEQGSEGINKFNQILKTCRNCGGSYPHAGNCPAYNKHCKKCGKLNHFAKVCRGKHVKQPQIERSQGSQEKRENKHTKHIHPVTKIDHQESDSSDENYLYAIKGDKAPKVNVKVCEHSFKATVDTGATINVIDQETFAKMKRPEIRPTNIKAFAFTAQSPVKFIGKFEATIETRKRVTVATFYVTKTMNSGNLISSETAQELGLISLHLHNVSMTNDKKLDATLHKHTKVFHGLGKLKGETVKLNIDKDHTPKAQPQRRIPFHIRADVKQALEELQQQDIIERVPEDQPTPWVSPIVAVPKKNGGVRICVDMRLANEAIKRVRHPIPTVEDISFELNGAKYFSKLDLSQAYHQLELEEASRYITTFSTHIGLFRYKRLNYGTNAAAEIFQYTLQTQLQGLRGVKNIADDIIIFGKTREEHDLNLEQCLKRLSDKGLRLNQSKCTFLSPTLSFFGQVFSSQGCKPDPQRVNDLQNAQIPRSVHDVRSLLGMANYSSKYIANFATITSPLRELTKKNAKFEWTERHQKAFNDLTKALSSAECMAYFDKEKETYVTVDASPVGVSAILSQKAKQTNEEKVLAYASRALTDVEKRYSQTEKEALAIVWGVEHFHLYLYGNEFVLVTDHKPLEIIYGNRKSKPSARIERWVLRLQPYSFTVVYKPGKQNPADYLSRHPKGTSTKLQKMTEEYVNYIAHNSVPKALTLEQIKQATDADQTLKGLRAAIKLGKWDYDVVKPFKNIKDELTVTTSGIILRGSRIVIPESLQQRAIDIAHETHPGISKTKALLREKIWFPNIDNMVKQTIDRCIPCQAVGKHTVQEPLAMTDMPKGPWETLHLDFYGPLPSGEYLLVVIDRYSRFPEVEVVKSTKASVVVPKLDKIFATHGIPTLIKTDNGPPFNGDDYSRYLKALGIKPEFATPLWPQGNAEAERFMQPLGKTLRTARIENRPWQQELNRFLLQYRTTPHTTTGVPPAELLFNRTVKGKLPILQKRITLDRHKEARQNETAKKEYHKQHADSKRNVKKSEIKVGDSVLVRKRKQDKLTPYFSEVPYKVTHRHHSRVTAQSSSGHIVTRNVSHFKPVRIDIADDTDDDDDENEAVVANNNNGNDNRRDDHDIGNGPLLRRSHRNIRRPDRYGHPISWTLSFKKGK